MRLPDDGGSKSALDLEGVGRRLTSERDQTASRLAALEQAFEEVVSYSAGTPPDDEHDPEGATVAWERGQIAALRDQARTRLAEIDHALERLSEGSYGRCAMCGGPIGHERLEARPGTVRCLSCASK